MNFIRSTIPIGCALLALNAFPAAAVDATKPTTPELSLLRQLDQGFIQVFEKIAPAVVVIETDKKAGDEKTDADAFQYFFNNPQGRGNDDDDQGPQQQPAPRRQFRLPRAPARSEGSGFISRADGYIFTNNHVVADADTIQVRLKDGRKFSAKIIGADERTDVAVLKIDATGLPVAELGDSDALRVGQLVCAIGVPYNLDYSFTAGWVSAKGRSNLTNTTYEDYIQTDAFINPGNSGGPLFDVDGKVVGMNTLINGIGRGLAFAIPSNMLREVGDQLIEKGSVTRSWLGIHIKTLSDDSLLAAQSPGVEQGVIVETIEPDAPAYKSDLRPADVITSVDGVKVSAAHDLQKEILKKKVGQQVKLTVWRNGKSLDVPLTTGELPTPTAKLAVAPEKKPNETSAGFGLHLQDIDKDMAEKLNLQSVAGALVTDIAPGSPAAEADVQRNDVITEVDSQPVKDAASAQALIKNHDAKKAVLLFLDRGGQKTYAVLKPNK